MVPNTMRRFPSNASSIQIPLDRRAFRQPQQPLERLWQSSGLKETHGKHVSQHRRCQATFQASPRTEPTEELREAILCQPCSLL